MSELDELRKRIDETDLKLTALLEERVNISKAVAEYKMSVSKNVYDPVRENEKLEKTAGLIKDKDTTEDVLNAVKDIIRDSRLIQYRELESKCKTDYPVADEWEITGGSKKIVYQGVKGSYSYIASKKFFGKEAEYMPVSKWRDAVNEILNGKADYAVLPIENSTAGSVDEIYDLLFEFPVYICAEQYVEVEHALLAAPGATMEDIEIVSSHEQALSQCEKFLNGNPSWKLVKTDNTALSATEVAKRNDKRYAAIASTQAAEEFGLNILKERINDIHGNTTRFVILSSKENYRENAEKISIVFETANEKGTLYNILSHLVYNGLNMTKIESRPFRDKSWNSRFFVDFEGNIRDLKVRCALRGIREESEYMRLIGNY